MGERVTGIFSLPVPGRTPAQSCWQVALHDVTDALGAVSPPPAQTFFLMFLLQAKTYFYLTDSRV